jgi:hypothetical protein
MDRRASVLLGALGVAVVAFALCSMTAPQRVLACSCAPPPSLAEAAADPTKAIVLAAIGRWPAGGRELIVEGSFGPVPVPEVMLVSGFGPQGAACQHGGSMGERWLFVLYRANNGQYSVSSCSLTGRIGTDQGNGLLADAIAAFGPARQPGVVPSDPPAAPAAIDPAPWLGGLGWAALLVGASTLVFAAVIFVARRRPTP